MNGNVISVGKHRHKKCGKDVISVNIVAIVLVGFFALLCLIPFYLIIVASFTDETYLIRNGYPIFPQLQSLSTAAYQLCLKNPVQDRIFHGEKKFHFISSLRLCLMAD